MSYAQPFPLARPASLERTAFGPDLAVRLICPDCRDPNPNIVEEFSSGDLVCGTCGLVLGDRVVDTRSECKLLLHVLTYCSQIDREGMYRMFFLGHLTGLLT
jgi:hypothetical protein